MAIIKPTIASATSVGQKRPRAVRFNTTVKHVLDTRRTPEYPNTWYNAEDMTSFKRAIRCDLQNLSTGRVRLEETEDVSWRGLEVYTQKNKKFQKHRRERRAFLVKGIKDLQKRLGDEGLPADGALRKLMIISSRPAVQEAQRLAQQDSNSANHIYLEQFLVPTVNSNKMELADVQVLANDGLPPATQQLITARTA